MAQTIWKWSLYLNDLNVLVHSSLRDSWKTYHRPTQLTFLDQLSNFSSTWRTITDYSARMRGQRRILSSRSRASQSRVRQVATRHLGVSFPSPALGWSYIRLRQHVSAAAGARKFSPGDKIFQVVARSLSRAIVPRWNIGRLFLAAAYSSSPIPEQCSPSPLSTGSGLLASLLFPLSSLSSTISPAIFFFSSGILSSFSTRDLLLGCLISVRLPLLCPPLAATSTTVSLRSDIFSSVGRAPVLAQELHELWLAY